MPIIFAVLQRIGGRAKAGDLEELYRELYGPLVAYFRHRDLSLEQSEELAQDTFLRAHAAFDEFRHESKASTWIFSIAQNLYRNYLRDRAALKRGADEVPIDDDHETLAIDEPAAVDSLTHRERTRLLHRAIHQLPPRMRQCVSIRVATGESYREIGGRLGIGASAAKSQVSLATGRLRGLLGDHYPELEQVLAGRKGGDDGD